MKILKCLFILFLLVIFLSCMSIPADSETDDTTTENDEGYFSEDGVFFRIDFPR